jgi:predicted  nucleic acid-binding Zn-ribbon protein
MGHQCLKCGVLYPEGSTVILRGCPECRGTRFFFTTSALGADERKKMMNGTELTLREAIEELVQKAKDGSVDPETDHWMLAGPTPKPIIVDPAIVPPDLPSRPTELDTISKITEALQTPSNLVVKLPKTPKKKRNKREGPRWDYVAPPEYPEAAPEAPPLFSYQGIKPVASTATLPPKPAPIPEPTPVVAPTVEAAPPEPTPAAPTVQSTLPMEATPDIQAQIAKAIHVEPSVMEDGTERPETIHIAAPGHYEIDVKRLMESSPVVIQKDGTYLIHLASLFESVPRPKK